MSGETFQVAFVPNPLRMSERTIQQFFPGLQLHDVLQSYGWPHSSHTHTRIVVNDQVVEDFTLEPEVGDLVCVIAVPKDPFTMFFLFAELGIWLGLGVGYVGAFATVMTAGFYVGLGYGLRGLVDNYLADQDFGGAGGKKLSPTLANTGNAIAPFEPVPCVYGTHRVFPPHAALPFTDSEGDDMFARMLFLPTIGSATLSDLYIGETAIGEYEDALYDEGFQYYPGQVFQAWPGSPFPTPQHDESRTTGWCPIRTTAQDIHSIAIEISFPGGLFRYADSGSPRWFGVYVDIEYRNVSGGAPTGWTKAHTASNFWGLRGDGRPEVVNDMIRLRGFIPHPFIKNFRWAVTKGTYEIRIRRVDPSPHNALPGGANTGAVGADFVWRSLRSFRYEIDGVYGPLNFDTLDDISPISLKLPLTDQTGGTVDNFSLLVKRKLRIYDSGHTQPGETEWDSDDWTVNEWETRNPAAAFRDVFQGTINANPVADSDLDVTAISAWFTQCETDSRYLDLVVDTRMTAFELGMAIARSARADIDVIDGKISVVQDVEKTQPTQLITARNCNSFSMRRLLDATPHALRMRHINIDAAYEPNWETTAYHDDYDENTATDIREVALVGAWTQEDAWKEGRYLLAVHELRPRVISCMMDVESLAVRRGDLVYFAHDGALLGQTWGRVKALNYALFDDCDDYTTWTALSGCTLSDDGAVFAKADSSVNVWRTTTGVYGMQQTSLGGLDWSDTVLRFWVRLNADAHSGLTATDGVRVGLDDTVGGNDTWWGLGTNDITEANVWYQVEVDFDNDTPVVAGGVDTTDVDELTLQRNSIAAGAGVWLDEVDTVANPNADILSIETDNDVVFVGGRSYKIQPRVSTANGFVVTDGLVTNPVVVNDPDLWTRSLTLSSAITSDKPSVGDLYAFGQTETVTRECIVQSIKYDSDLQASFGLVDHSPAIFDAETGDIPDFDPGSGLPVAYTFVGPAQPQIIDVVTDERALGYNEQGSLVPQVLVTFAPTPTSTTRPAPEHYEIGVREVNAEESLLGDWRARSNQPAEKGFVTIKDVLEGSTYDFRFRAVAQDGRASQYAITTSHLIIGKSSPPPDVESFRIEGNVLMWQLPYEPRDLAGFRIKVISGDVPNWVDAPQIHSESLIAASPWPMDSTPYGKQTFMIKAVDVAGNESENFATILTDLGDPQVDNVVVTVDYHDLGFPRVPDGNVSLFDNCNSTALWATIGGASDVETEQTVMGDENGSIRVVAQLTPIIPCYMYRTAGIGPLDRSNCIFRFWVFPLFDTMTDNEGMRVQFSSGSDTLIINYGYDRVTIGQWNLIEIDLERERHQYGLDTFDSSAITNIHFYHNLYAPKARGWNIVYYDEMEWVGGGPFETTEVDGATGDLLTQTDATFWTSDNAFFWSGTSSNWFWYSHTPEPGMKGGSYKTGTYRFDMLPDDSWTPSTISIEMNDPGAGSYLEYMPPSDVIFWNSSNPALDFWEGNDQALFWHTGGGFVPWPGQIAAKGRERYTGRLTMLGGSGEGRVTQFDVIYDVPDVVEYFEDIAISDTGDPQVAPTKTFQSIESVTVTVQDVAASEAISAIVKSKSDPVGGPVIHLYNSSGRVAKNVDIVMKGY
jgi:hypothetical protein